MLLPEEARERRWALYREISDSRGTSLAEQLSWMAEPWVPGAWDPQLFGPGKLLGRGRGTCCVSVPQSPREYSDPIEATRNPRPAGHLTKRVLPSAGRAPRPSLPAPRPKSAAGRRSQGSPGRCFSDFQTLLSILAALAIFQSSPDLLNVLSPLLLRYLSPIA